MIEFELAVEALMDADEIVVLTGAGISAESGIPTYREPLTGIWAEHEPESLETTKAYRENPQLVWGWYMWRRQQAAKAQPNAAHMALRRMEDTGRKVSIITQNVDDLHERAGSSDVLHLHGSLASPKCFACHRSAEMDSNQPYITGYGALIEPPRCRKCGGKMRPGVLWYGEQLPARTWKSAMSRVETCDVLIAIGTSLVVKPAGDIPDIALAAGTPVIYVNTTDLGMDPEFYEIMLLGKATDVVSRLCASMENGLSAS